MAAKDTKIKGLGITRDELRRYLQSRVGEMGDRPSVLTEMYDKEDLSLITETHGRMITPKVRMKVILAACDPRRHTPLVQVFINEYNKEMVSFERQGRQELLGALQALAAAGEEGEHAVPLGRGIVR
jgi:hypothetical protein